MLLTLPDSVVHSSTFLISTDRGEEEREREREHAQLLLIRYVYDIEFLYPRVHGACYRVQFVRQQQSQYRACQFVVSEMYKTQSISKSLQFDTSAFLNIVIDVTRYSWHMHYMSYWHLENRAHPRFTLFLSTSETTKTIIALSYVQHAFYWRSVTDTRHDSLYDNVHFQGWTDALQLYSCGYFSQLGYSYEYFDNNHM